MKIIDNPFDLSYARAICQNSSSQILAEYLRSQKVPVNVVTNLLNKQQKEKDNNKDYSAHVMSFIATLPINRQERIFADFRAIKFFLDSVEQGKKERLNQTDQDSFSFLLKYIQTIYNIPDLFTGDVASLYDRLLYLLIKFRQGFYQGYFMHSHLEAKQTVWTIRKYSANSLPVITKEILQTNLLILQEQIMEIFKHEKNLQNHKTFILQFDNKVHLHFSFTDKNGIFESNFVVDIINQTVAISSTLPLKESKLYNVFAKVVLKHESLPVNENDTIFDLPLFLKRLTTSSSKIKAFINTYGIVKSFYINKLTFALPFAQTDVTLDSKHRGCIQSLKEHIAHTCHILKNSNMKIKSSDRHLLKSAEIIATVKLPYQKTVFRKRFFINNQGQTDLGFDIIGELIKNCLRKSRIMTDTGNQSIFFTVKNFSNNFVYQN